MNHKTDDYKYYKIIRKYDGFISYCNVLNFIDTHFKMIFGNPIKWIESEEKTVLKLRRGEIMIPLRIEAETDDSEYDIILSKQEFTEVPLKYLK